MESDSKNSFGNLLNPIDEVEEILFAYGLEFLRKNKDEIFLRYSGIWNNYEMSFSWIKNSNLVQINNDLSISIPEEMIIGIFNNEASSSSHGLFTSPDGIFMASGSNLETSSITSFVIIETIYFKSSFFERFLNFSCSSNVNS